MLTTETPFALRFASGPRHVSASAHTYWDPALKGYLATERGPGTNLKEAMTQFGPITDPPYELPE